jgi:hypothetical protein
MTVLDMLGGVGLLLLMGAFIASLAGWLQPTAWLYLLLNAVGSAILAAYSAAINVWIFVVLEGLWSAVALWSLIRILATPAQRTQ